MVRTRGVPYHLHHPQNQGRIERYHRTLENVVRIGLTMYTTMTLTFISKEDISFVDNNCRRNSVTQTRSRYETVD